MGLASITAAVGHRRNRLPRHPRRTLPHPTRSVYTLQQQARKRRPQGPDRRRSTHRTVLYGRDRIVHSDVDIHRGSTRQVP